MNSLMVQYKLEDYYKDLNTIKKPIFVLDKLIESFHPKVGALFVSEFMIQDIEVLGSMWNRRTSLFNRMDYDFIHKLPSFQISC